jgi:hypothetical protein
MMPIPSPDGDAAGFVTTAKDGKEDYASDRLKKLAMSPVLQPREFFPDRLLTRAVL